MHVKSFSASCAVFLGLLAAASPLPANASTFTVHLTNGTSISTLRQPRQAAWDREVVLVITDAGNWIGVPKASVKEISSSVEARGIGRVIDSKTIGIGWMPNDEPGEGEGEAEEPGQGAPQTAADRAADRFGEFLDSLQDRSTGSQPNVTTEQFVNPEDTTGIPISILGDGTTPYGGVGSSSEEEN